MSETSQNQPSEEDLRAYLDQLRDADAAEVVAQAYSMMATGAEVKLGRPDARLLIDALGGMVQAIAGQLPEQLATGMRSGLSQLQMAQVQREGQPQKASAAAAAGDAGSTGAAGGQPSGAASAGSGPGGQTRQPPEKGESSLTDRLWIPGRGQ